MTAALLGLALAWAPAAAAEPPADDALAILRELVPIDTTNPPGNETAAARALGDRLGAAGIEFGVYESTPGRGNLVARLKGDGSARPLLLLAHLDVVGVEEDRWSAPPFAAVEKGGFLYGRGTIDDKGQVAVFAAALIHAKKSGLALKRDLILLASADEESGGTWGVRWMLENHPEAFEAEYALNEGGSIELRGGAVARVGVQATEKLYHDVKLTLRGPGGHASIPSAENPVYPLARALARLEQWQPEVRLNPVSRAFLEGMAQRSDPLFREAAEGVLSGDPGKQRAGVRALGERHPEVRAVLQDTAVPTVVQAGIRNNVIPSEASINLNCRLLPDTETEDFIARLEEAIDDPRIEITVVTRPEPNPPPIMPLEGPLYEALQKTARAYWPQAVFVPYMSTGATDSEYLRRAGIKTYGIGLPLEAADQMRMHGADERVSLDGLALGARFVYSVIEELNR